MPLFSSSDIAPLKIVECYEAFKQAIETHDIAQAEAQLVEMAAYQGGDNLARELRQEFNLWKSNQIKTAELIQNTEVQSELEKIQEEEEEWKACKILAHLSAWEIFMKDHYYDLAEGEVVQIEALGDVNCAKKLRSKMQKMQVDLENAINKEKQEEERREKKRQEEERRERERQEEEKLKQEKREEERREQENQKSDKLISEIKVLDLPGDLSSLEIKDGENSPNSEIAKVEDSLQSLLVEKTELSSEGLGEEKLNVPLELSGTDFFSLENKIRSLCTEKKWPQAKNIIAEYAEKLSPRQFWALEEIVQNFLKKLEQDLSIQLEEAMAKRLTKRVNTLLERLKTFADENILYHFQSEWKNIQYLQKKKSDLVQRTQEIFTEFLKGKEALKLGNFPEVAKIVQRLEKKKELKLSAYLKTALFEQQKQIWYQNWQQAFADGNRVKIKSLFKEAPQYWTAEDIQQWELLWEKQYQSCRFQKLLAQKKWEEAEKMIEKQEEDLQSKWKWEFTQAQAQELEKVRQLNCERIKDEIEGLTKAKKFEAALVLAKKLVPLEEDLSYLQIQKAIQIEAVQYQQELDAEWGKSLWAEMQKHDLADFHFLLDWEKVHPAPGEWQDWWWKLIKNLDPVDDLYENYLADLSGQIKKRWQEYRGWEQKQHLEFLIDQLKQAEEKQNYLKIQDLLREQVDILNAEEYESWFKKAAYLELKARESAQKKDLDRCLQKLEKYQLEADDQLLWDTFLAYSDIFNQEKYHFYKQKALNILKTAVTRWINSDQFILSRAVLDFLTERNEEVADLQSLYQKQEENFNLINNIPQDKTAQSKNRILLAYQKWINNKELNYEDDVSWQYLLQKEPVLTVVLNHLQLDQKAQNAEKWRQNSYAETIANFTDASLLLDWAKLNFSVLSYENLCRFQSQYLNLEREKNLQRLEACQAQSENILAYIRPFLLAEPDWVFQQEYYQPYFQAEVKSPHTQVSTAEYYYYWEKGEYEEAKKYLLNLPLAELLVAVQKIDDYEKQQDRIFWQKKFAAGVALLEKYLYKNDWEGVDRYFSELNNKLPVDFYLSERISLLEKFQSHFAQMKSELSMQINDYLQNNQFSSAQNLLVDLKEWESKVKILYQKWQTKLQAFQLAVNDLEKFIEKQDLDRIEHLLVLTEGSFSLPEQKYLQKLYRQFLEQKKWQNLDFLALLEDYLNNEDFKGLQQELEALEFKDLNYWTWKSKLTLAQNTQKEKIGSLNWQKNQEKILKCAQTKNESLFYVTIKRLDDNQAWQLAVLYWTELAQKTLADFRDYLVQIRKQFKADPSLIEAELSKINSQLLELCTWGDKSVIDDFWEFLQELHQVFNELNLNWGHGLVTHTCLEDKENNSALRLLQTEGDLVKWRQFLLSHLPKLDYQTWLSSWEALIQEEKTLAMANYEALIRLKEQELSQAYEENNSLGFQAKMAEMAELLSYTDFCKLQETWKKAMQKMYELQLKEDKKTQKLKEARVKELEKIVRMNLKAYNMEELETYYQELELLGELSLVQKLKQETQKVCSSRDYQKFLIRKLIAEKRFDEADQLLKQL